MITPEAFFENRANPSKTRRKKPVNLDDSTSVFAGSG
jgi:hypothetical protein